MSKLSIIGAGNMGFAILSGIIKSGICRPKEISVADKSEPCRKRAENLGANVFESAAEAVSGAEYVILAVKPQGFGDISREVATSLKKEAVITSILAGKRIETYEAAFGSNSKIIRVMPNTPAMAGMGMSGLCRNANVSDDEFWFILSVFSSFGAAREVPEELMDTVTGISGSGPAYVYMFISGLIKAAVKNGMSEEDAKVFAVQTVLGSAKLAMESEDSPEQLKIKVCSPGGTTIEAVKVFEECGLEDIIVKAVDACINRSKELSR